ncbi:hypothetical protein WJX73_007181 [Symbiochloris irregularis]|uniref:Uncharacterized protein n=1 Tax=Symbiochloris irregularis TaxID=706552 RepID=A0AAW1NZ47_9CHLO
MVVMQLVSAILMYLALLCAYGSADWNVSITPCAQQSCVNALQVVLSRSTFGDSFETSFLLAAGSQYQDPLGRSWTLQENISVSVSAAQALAIEYPLTYRSSFQTAWIQQEPGCSLEGQCCNQQNVTYSLLHNQTEWLVYSLGNAIASYNIVIYVQAQVLKVSWSLACAYLK